VLACCIVVLSVLCWEMRIPINKEFAKASKTGESDLMIMTFEVPVRSDCKFQICVIMTMTGIIDISASDDRVIDLTMVDGKYGGKGSFLEGFTIRDFHYHRSKNDDNSVDFEWL